MKKQKTFAVKFKIKTIQYNLVIYHLKEYFILSILTYLSKRHYLHKP